MSVRMMTLVWELELADSEKLVLLALADCANDEGYCWPSVETLKKKCSKSERTVQNCIRALCVKGHLTQRIKRGKGCDYTVHPIVRFASTPAAAAPRKDCAPQPLLDTPAAAAPNPRSGCTQTIKNHKKPPRARKPIPDDWMPSAFGVGTKSREVIDSWPDGELEAQLEQFKANHRAKGNTFIDPQDAWQTWALNTRKFGIGKAASGAPKYVSASGYEYRGDEEAVMKEAQRRGDNQTYWIASSNRKRRTESAGNVASEIVRRAASG